MEPQPIAEKPTQTVVGSPSISDRQSVRDPFGDPVDSPRFFDNIYEDSSLINTVESDGDD